MAWRMDHIQIIFALLQTDNHSCIIPVDFYRPNALPGAQPTVSEHWRHSDLFVTKLLSKISPYFKRVATLPCKIFDIFHSGLWPGFWHHSVHWCGYFVALLSGWPLPQTLWNSQDIFPDCLHHSHRCCGYSCHACITLIASDSLQVSVHILQKCLHYLISSRILKAVDAKLSVTY